MTEPRQITYDEIREGDTLRVCYPDGSEMKLIDVVAEPNPHGWRSKTTRNGDGLILRKELVSDRSIVLEKRAKPLPPADVQFIEGWTNHGSHFPVMARLHTGNWAGVTDRGRWAVIQDDDLTGWKPVAVVPTETESGLRDSLKSLVEVWSRRADLCYRKLETTLEGKVWREASNCLQQILEEDAS